MCSWLLGWCSQSSQCLELGYACVQHTHFLNIVCVCKSHTGGSNSNTTGIIVAFPFICTSRTGRNWLPASSVIYLIAPSLIWSAGLASALFSASVTKAPLSLRAHPAPHSSSVLLLSLSSCSVQSLYGLW